MDQYLPEGLSMALQYLFGTISRIEPYISWTVVIGPEYLLEEYGWKNNYIFLASLLAAYPLGLIMHLLPYGKARHIFSLATGTILLQLVWGVHWIHTPFTSMISYAMLRLCPRDKVQRIVPTFLMSYLTVAHFQHQCTITNYLGMDVYFTCSQMILTQKLYMLAYNVHDGYLISRESKTMDNDKMDVDDNNALKAAKSCSEYALTECPSLLEFLGYCFCFSTVLVGPAFEFSQYRSACDGSLHYITSKDGTRKLRGKSIPNNILPTLVPLIKCVALIIFSSIFDRACNYRRLTSPWYFNLTSRQRFVYNWITNFVQRLKVYLVWLMAEGSNNIWYAGFDGYDKETGESKGWTVGSGADIWKLETCESIKVGTKAWNKKTSQWLLKYVYIRNRSRLAIVYAVSAIWHGFYPGYYLLASFVWFMSQCERLGRKKISPHFSEKKWSIYGVTCIITIHALGSYATTAFFLRSMENVMENWRSHHFWGHIACLFFYLLVSQLSAPPPKAKTLHEIGVTTPIKSESLNIENYKLESKYS